MMSELLLDIYACPADPDRWPAVLDALRDRLEVRCAALQYFTRNGDDIEVKWLARDSASQADEAHHDPYVSGVESPRVRSDLSAVGMFVRDRDLFEPGNRTAARLHERLGALRLGFFLGAGIGMGPGSRLVLALHRDIDDPRDFGAPEEEFLRLLLPHLRQSVHLTQRLEVERRERLDLQEALDHLQCGIVLCDREARPRWLNQAANRLLRGQPPAALLRRVRANPAEPHCLALGALQALVVPLADQMMVLLAERGTPPVLSADLLGRLFTLTPAESRLTASLCQGATVADYARSHRISVGTVRFQLKQILAKTNTARQSELVREVCMSVAAQALTPRTW